MTKNSALANDAGGIVITAENTRYRTVITTCMLFKRCSRGKLFVS